MSELDKTFARAAIQQKLLTTALANAALRAQALLQKHGISKPAAEIAVEAGWMKEDAAAAIARKVDGHPPIAPRHATFADEAAAQQVAAPVRAQAENLAAELEKLGYKRSAAEILIDKGVLQPAAAAASEPRRGTRKITSKREGTKKRVTTVRPPMQKSTKIVLLAGAAGAVLVIAVVLLLFTDGGGGDGGGTSGTTAASPSPSPTAKSPLPAPTRSPTPSLPPQSSPSPTPEATPTPKPVDPDEQFRREVEEQRRLKLAEDEKTAEKLYTEGRQQIADAKFEEAFRTLQKLQRGFPFTQFVKSRKDEIDKLVDDARNRRLVATAPTKSDPEKPAGPDPARAEYEKRCAERVAAARRRVEETRRAIESERAAETKRWKDLQSRIAAQKFQVRMKSGYVLRDATVVELGREELKVAYSIEGGGAVQANLTWDMLDDASFALLMRAVHRDPGAAGQYELGRQFVARKMWKDAKAAFDACVKADASFRDRIPDLAPILNNQAAFRGASRRLGRDGLALTYDFAAPEQAEDFTPRGGQSKEVTAKGLELSARGEGYFTIKDVDYLDEVLIETVVSVEKDGYAAFPVFLDWEGNGYSLSLNNGDKGFELAKLTQGKRETLVEKKELSLGAEVTVRVSVKAGDFKVLVDGQEALAATDATHKKGWCGVGVWRGKAAFRKLSIQGKVNPIEIDKRFAEAEVLVRRALEGDLSPKRDDTKHVRDVAISAEDPYFMRMLKDEEKEQYGKVKEKALRILQHGISDWEDLKAATLFDPIIGAAPEFYAARYWKARVELWFGNTPQARRELVRYCLKDPNFYEAYAVVGATWEEDQDYEKALYYAQKTLEKMPDCAPAIGLQGFLAFVLRADAKAALADLELAQRLDPHDEDTRRKHRSIVNVVRGPEHLGCKHKKEFPHFWVMTDISMEKTQLYGERLEAAYKYYAETFREFFKEDPKRVKPRVAIFNTREAYMTYSELTLLHRQEFTLGYFMPPFRELLLFEDVDLNETLQTLYHEAFHQFMSMMVPRPPYWYNEGIAEYMGSITIEKGKVVQKAQILEGRLKGLKRYLDNALGFADIMKQSPGEFYSGPVGFKYGQAWSMLHFFYEHEGGKHRKLIDSYFRALLEGKELDDAFDAAFGEADLKPLEAEWKAYVQKLELPKKAEPPKKPEAPKK